MVENELPIGSPLLAIVIQEDKTFTASELCLDRIEFIFATQTLTLAPIEVRSPLILPIEVHHQSPDLHHLQGKPW
jgi:hypothetical protein